MVQDLLKFLRPSTPLRPREVDQYPRNSPSPTKKIVSIRPTTAGSINILCRIPSPLRRRPKSTFEPIHGDLSQLSSFVSTKPSDPSFETPDERLTRPSELLPDTFEMASSTADCGQAMNADIKRTRRSDIHHIAQLRKLSDSRTGHWIKVCKIALSPSELKSFHLLRRAQQGPVSKADVLAHCSFVLRAHRKDANHKPLKLADERYGQAAKRELWAMDPFSGEVWSVKWVSERSISSQLLSGRELHDWTKATQTFQSSTIRTVNTKPLEALRIIQSAELSTIRVVA